MGQNNSTDSEYIHLHGVCKIDIKRLEGDWWFVAQNNFSAKNVVRDEGSNEYSQTLTWNEENGKMEFERKGYCNGEVNPYTVVQGQFWPTSCDNPALFNIHFGGFQPYMKFIVCWTNYDQYTLIHSLKGTTYLLSRNRKVPTGDKCFISDLLRRCGMSPNSVYINNRSIDKGGAGNKIVRGESIKDYMLPKSIQYTIRPNNRSFVPRKAIAAYNPIRHQGVWWQLGTTSQQAWDENSHRIHQRMKWNNENNKMEYSGVGFKDGKVNPYTVFAGQFWPANKSLRERIDINVEKDDVSHTASLTVNYDEIAPYKFWHHRNGWPPYSRSCILWTNYSQWLIYLHVERGVVYFLSRQPTISIYNQCNLQNILTDIGVNPNEMRINNIALDYESAGVKIEEGEPLMDISNM